jgi:NAD(P)-dependent dehydrogenase (short-subunit alcohol dehydrogenase family)
MAGLFDLAGKTALITGASRGLGLQMAMAFADHGADLIIASRKLDACEAAAEQVRARGRKAFAFAAHCGRWDEIDGLIARAYGVVPRIDILVNNAGMGPAIPSPQVTEDMFDKVVGLNFKGPFRLAAQIGARMRDGDGGTILNISSIASVAPMPTVVAYAGAKAALNAMTVSLAHEFAPKVRVNAILAGPFLTDIAKAWTAQARETAPNALRRPGKPEEIITSALYLVSPASSFTTGALLRVDGAMMG